jgi:hypothetical protein
MAIDWVAIVNKVPDVAILVIFVWFTREMVQSQRESAASIMSDWKGFIQAQNIGWQQFIEQRDTVYLDKLDVITNLDKLRLESLFKELSIQTAAMTRMIEQMSTYGDLLKYIAEDVRDHKRAN